MTIHTDAEVDPTARVEAGASIARGARIGPFCVIGADVDIGPDVRIHSHCVITGVTTIGEGTEVFPFTVLGEVPQDLKYKGEKTRLEIGARNRIREHVTMNTGTEGGGGVTRLGDDCLLMAGVHVAHDCQVGDRVILVNNAGLAGHAVVEDDVIVGGLSGVHQWVRVGRGAIIGAVTMVAHDVIPYGLVQAPRGRLDGLNLVGLKRRGVSRADIAALRGAFETLRDGEGSFLERTRALADGDVANAHIQEIIDFVTGASDRHFLTPVRQD
ncbi:MAG: acyl-ACP--UDP-N-acetylglucosamine O-acyltransferase [Pseudomonadota bacterium]